MVVDSDRTKVEWREIRVGGISRVVDPIRGGTTRNREHGAYRRRRCREINLANCMSLSKSDGSTEIVRRHHLTGQMIGLQRRTRSAVLVAPSVLALRVEDFLDVSEEGGERNG